MCKNSLQQCKALEEKSTKTRPASEQYEGNYASKTIRHARIT